MVVACRPVDVPAQVLWSGPLPNHPAWRPDVIAAEPARPVGRPERLVPIGGDEEAVVIEGWVDRRLAGDVVEVRRCRPDTADLMPHPYLVMAQTSEEGDTEPVGDGADEIESVDICVRQMS
jgi:hypothetical protein